ncbi:MAG: transcriptional regulator [Xanthomonadales bacterium]|nr:transcriptional regulator [Xanthomonadales bacterium]
MSKLERLYHLKDILSQARAPMPRQRLMEELGCSQATLYRLINELRDTLQAPIENNEHGYYYDRTLAGKFELPGIWISPEELQALLTARQVLGNVQPGLLEEELGNIQTRISNLLQTKGVEKEGQSSRINMQSAAGRVVPERMFQAILGALMSRKKLRIEYHTRGTDQQSERTISPQRLTNYRNSWYLDAWCHQRTALRSFSLERIQQQVVLDEDAKELPMAEVQRYYDQSYGIFSGPANNTAQLLFTPERARWVADEQWHPQQQGEFMGDGSYLLKIPFSHSGELLMDILKYGSEVKVLAPDSLREQVLKSLQSAVEIYV